MPDNSQQLRDQMAQDAAAKGTTLPFDPKTGRWNSIEAFRQYNPNDPYGGQAPQKLSDFQTGANGLPMIVTKSDPNDRFASKAVKTRYLPKEYFDTSGSYIGPNQNAPDWNAQGSYFKKPLQWNYSEGKFERPTDWQHVVGTAMMAAGGVAGLANVGTSLASTALQGGFNTGLQSATSGSFDPKTAALNFIPGGSAGSGVKNTLVQAGLGAAKGAVTGGAKGALLGGATGAAGAQAGRLAPAVSANPLVQKGVNVGVNAGLNTARTGRFDPVGTAMSAGQAYLPNAASRFTNNPLAQKAINYGGGQGLAALTGRFSPMQAAQGAVNTFKPPTVAKAKQGGVGGNIYQDYLG